MRKTLIEEFDRCWREHSEKTAVVDQAGQISFKELAAGAVALAGLIADRLDGRRNVPVAVLLPKSTRVVMADLAISYSCNMFMNLDVHLPAARLQNILTQIKPALVLTDSAMAETAVLSEAPVVNLDTVQPTSEWDGALHDRLLECLREQIDTDPYCIINTSGSTGTPKGVVLNNRSFLDFYDWSLDTFHFDGSEVIGSLSPAVFDIYDYELCLLMMRGSTIVLLDASLGAFPARLLETVAKQRINFIFWVPTIMVNIANQNLLEKIDVSCLKTIWFAGEVFPTKQFNYWRRNLKRAVFANLYGPIEITLDCTYYIAENELPENEPLPIGYPCRNTDVLLLNDQNRLCSAGEIGELCVRGSSLAMGYYNNPEKTSVAFVQNPLNCAYPELIYRTGDLACRDVDGKIIFKGRKDSLIKHMGYRIELGEIEHIAVNTLKLVANCCVVYNKGKKVITLIYEKSEAIDGVALKKALGGQLPRYMVPAAYIEMDALPRNTNGKIDRLKLTEMVNAGQI